MPSPNHRSAREFPKVGYFKAKPGRAVHAGGLASEPALVNLCWTVGASGTGRCGFHFQFVFFYPGGRGSAFICIPFPAGAQGAAASMPKVERVCGVHAAVFCSLFGATGPSAI